MGTDEQLVRRVADGDEAALHELLRRYQGPLSSFLYRHTGGGEVDDLYQETWLRVVKNAGSFDSTKRFSTWLFQIAVNLCRDWYRHRRVAESNAESLATESIGVEHIEAALDAATLLATLSEDHREVLILRYYHDLTEEEVAEILDCPRGTVKSRMHHALARLSTTCGRAAKGG
jgi:RNA polymerase sigma-70 factor (ECF subfamily)